MLQDNKWAAAAGLPEAYCNKTPQQLLGSIVLPWLSILRQDFDAGFEKLLKYNKDLSPWGRWMAQRSYRVC